MADDTDTNDLSCAVSKPVESTAAPGPSVTPEAEALAGEALAMVEAGNPIGDAEAEAKLWSEILRVLWEQDRDSYRRVRTFALTFAAMLGVHTDN
jgi:hypothetical protein